MVDDYSDSSIYRIYNRNNPCDFYIGSTRCIRKRISTHYDAGNNENNPHYNFKLYTHIRDNGSWGFWIIDDMEMISFLNEPSSLPKNQLKPKLKDLRLMRIKIRSVIRAPH